MYERWERDYNDGRMEFSFEVTEPYRIDEIQQALKAFARHHSFAIHVWSYTTADPRTGAVQEVVAGQKLVAI
jgi:hypothetical protein